MSAHQAMYPVRTMARVLRVSASGYYAWRSRPASARATADADLTRRIRTIHAGSYGTYGAIAFGNRCKEAGIRPSTGSVGDAYDNAMCESFFATLECELIDRRRFRSHSEARMAVFQFIEGSYNPSRRHSALGYFSPIEYERKHDRITKPA